MSAQIDTERRTVRLRSDALSRAMSAHGWDTYSAAARACGLSHTTLTRVERGEVAPGPLIIAGLLTGTGSTFDELFEVVEL